MNKYLLKRLAFMGITLLAASILTFFLMNIIPGGTAEQILKHTVLEMEEIPPEYMISEISDRYNLNDPLYLQFGRWLERTLRGDMGDSYIFHQPVTTLIMLRLPATILLAVTSIIIAVLVGIPLGIVCALKENGPLDHVLRVVTLIGVSMPGFWLALLLILVFSIHFKIFPVQGYGTVFQLILPALALSVYTTAVTLRMMRTSLLETLGEQYVTFCVSKGLPKRYIITRHALKNAMLPIVTVLGMQMGHLVGGAVVIEKIFVWPGIGCLLVDAILARDIPVVQGCVLTIVGMFVLINFLVDAMYTYIDPTIRYG